MILLAESEGPDYCATAQADQCLRCPYMSEDTFLNGEAHFFSITPFENIGPFKGSTL